jgi:hypothetical protein
MKPTAVEIDQKLREDFRRRLREFGQESATNDPVLAVLFRSFAKQLESLYSDVDHMRLALLDELVDGLGFEKRFARPAQTVVRFNLNDKTVHIPAGTELTGQAAAGQKLTFLTDAGIAVSAARIAFGLTYQSETLRLIPGIEMPEEILAAQPGLDGVHADLGPHSAIYIAIENLAPEHLSNHGLFFQLSSEAVQLRRAIRMESWCLVGPTGRFSAQGIMRPRAANAGQLELAWLSETAGETASAAETSGSEAPDLPDGFYEGRNFVLPTVPQSRRFTCLLPQAMQTPMERIFDRGKHVLQQPRAWLRIALPGAMSDLHTGIASIFLHTVTASNVECLNQTIYFEKQGTSIPVGNNGSSSRFIVAPLSIVGEQGFSYVPSFTPSAEPSIGRYRIKDGRIILTPGRRPGDIEEKYANLRIWVSAGKLGNSVEPGALRTFMRMAPVPGLSLLNLTAAAGGIDDEEYSDARTRFAAALMSRGRVVTRTDLTHAVRSFDRRVKEVKVEADLGRTNDGIQRVYHITIVLDRNAFTDPEEEGRVLREEVSNYLEQRILFDLKLVVELEWV